MSVVLETTIGDITVDLYLKERPNACLNFLKLCKVKYYNLCIFHKVERNFIAQTGDPTSTGRGGESVFSLLYGEQAKYFDAEQKPRLKHEKLGTLSMVNNGNNMNGSQFFMTLGENITYLDEVHTVFGEVVEGFEILLKINEAICDPNNRPYQDIRITHTVILHDPFEDPAALEIPDASPIPSREQLESNYIGADEEIDDTKGKDAGEIEEKIKDSEAKARATILEMVGDIPDAEVRPPENVLFVCKLNPVTTSEDLEIIFSRFGPIVSCEVIKDKTSGESLQYAFIEFEKEEDCENAYFKMANVLIDDRRIHVDFSQSVSKLNWNSGSKFLKQNSGRFQNFLIKDKDKKSDGYEMIFDMERGSNSNRRTDKSKNRSPSHRKKRHSPEPYRDERHQTFSSSKKYKQSDRHFEDNQSSYKNVPNTLESSKSNKRHNRKDFSSKEGSSSTNLARNQRSKYDSSSESNSENAYEKSYKKKRRHDSSSSNSSSSSSNQSFGNRKKYSITTKNLKEKALERKGPDFHARHLSNSPERYSNKKYSSQKYRSRSRSFEKSRNKKRTMKEIPLYRRSRSTSHENSQRKNAIHGYRKSPSSSPQSSNRKKKPSKRSKSRSPENSNYQKKASRQTHVANSPEASSRKKKRKSLCSSPETSKYKRKALNKKSHCRSRSSSPEIVHQKMKEAKERHSRAKYQSKSPEPNKQHKKYSKKASSSSRSSSSESPKRREKPSKHISCPSRSLRSSEASNRKSTSNYKKSYDHSKFQMHCNPKSKSSKTKNLTKYDDSDSDLQSYHKSGTNSNISDRKKQFRKRSSS